jgi:hypothetical protein
MAAAGEGTAEATTAMLGITGTLETMGTLETTATPEIMATPGTRGAQAATAPQETVEPQVAPGITETAKAMATRAEWATEAAKVAGIRMRGEAIPMAGEAHRARETPRMLENHRAKQPRPAEAIQPVKTEPLTEERRRVRKQTRLPESVSQQLRSPAVCQPFSEQSPIAYVL